MRRLFAFGFGLLMAAGITLAQGVQTGELTGIVKLQDGTLAPGVAVTVESAALQGKRSQTTGVKGDYIFKFLPPGPYTITFELPSMKSVTQKVSVGLGTSVRADAQLTVQTTEAVTVTGAAVEAEKTAVHGATRGLDEVQQLPVGRTIDQIASLAPSVTQKTPNGGQLKINGGFAYDNVFLVDGADVDDHYFATPTNQVIIEDAVAETQILTSNISAEYGRFSGGVINAITKSGGNDYHGSLRTDFSNDRWRARTPFENDSANGVPLAKNKVNEAYTGTVGGKIIQDRVWFFLAGRYFKNDNQIVLPVTGQTFTAADKEPRIEAKLTANISGSHTLQAAYTYSKESFNAVPFSFTIDSASQVFPEQPANLFVAKYLGVLTQNLFATLQYSQKKFAFKGYGGTSADIHDSPMICATLALCQFNAPYFDATDPEHRDNRQYAGSVNYYFASEKLGSHDIKLGGEVFRVTELGGNSQSSTGYVFYADYATNAAGKPLFDANNRLIPTFVGGTNLLLNWLPVLGAKGDITTSAAYLNDSVKIGSHFSANLGVRFDTVSGTGPTGAKLTKNHAFEPRLGAAYDILGDSKYILSGSYAEYAGGSNPNNFLQKTNVGNPNLVYSLYIGPDGQGRNFAPGFDPANYVQIGGSFPAANVFNSANLRSPVVREFTISAGGQLARQLYAAITYVNRNTRNFIEGFITFDEGKTHVVNNGVDLGFFDNNVFKNTNAEKRQYQALAFQTRAVVAPHWNVDLNYTYQIKYEGNFEGENTNQPAITSIFGDYPEIYVASRNFPDGRLNGYQKHRVRFITDYLLPTRFGDFGFGLVYKFDSGTPYSIRRNNFPVSGIQLSHDPGYATPPQTQPLYFGARGSQLFPSQSQFDLALNYDIPIMKVLSPWVKVTLLNVFNTHYLTGFNTAIVPCTKTTQAGCNGAAPLDANGLPTTYVNGPLFGKATGASSYQTPRTFQLSAGIRF